MTKTKIDFLINKMSGGGAERVVSLLANYLQNQNYQIRIITFQGSDKYPLDKNIERIKLHRHPFFQSVIVNGFFGLLKFYRKKSNRPDIISSHIHLLGLMTIPISRIYKIPIIVSEHNNHLAKPNPFKNLLWNNFYKYADAVTILTDFDADFFKARNPKTYLMPNPCSFDVISQDEPKKRKKEILAVGDLNRIFHKGFDNLIDIAEEALADNSEWCLKIIGGGEKGLEELRNMVENRKLEKKIIFTGFQTDIKERLANAEIFILSSRYEGLPMVLLEAMSQGTACIAYDCISGPSDIITHLHNGILVKNQDKEEMVKWLKKLIEDTDLRRKFNSNAPLALEKFSINSVGEKWNVLVQNTLSASK